MQNKHRKSIWPAFSLSYNVTRVRTRLPLIRSISKKGVRFQSTYIQGESKRYAHLHRSCDENYFTVSPIHFREDVQLY